MKYSIKILLIICLIVIAGCTYQRPLFSIRTSTAESIDSITHQTTYSKNYNYWGIKRISQIGSYAKFVTFDSLKNKIAVFYMKRNSNYMNGGYFRDYKKVCYYSASGRREKTTKYIKLNNCRYSTVVVDKTIYYKNGKLHSKENLKTEN